MKELFRGYFPFSDEENSDMWENCIFVFDTNVLLSMYKYKEKTRTAFIDLLNKIKDRIWIPYHVAYEFLINKDNTLISIFKNYDECISELHTMVNKIKALSQKNSKNENDCSIFLEEINKIIIDNIDKIKNKKMEHQKELNDDDILLFIENMFKGKVGDNISEKTINEYKEEGKKRYEDKIPPGYADNQKKENKYGDFIIWKEMKDKSKKDNKHIIFISEDRKEDWIKNVNGEKKGPRPELINEFYNENKKLFYMYNTESFLFLSNKYIKSNISNDMIDEIKNINDSNGGEEYKNIIYDCKEDNNIDQLFNIDMEMDNLEVKIDKISNQVDNQIKDIHDILTKNTSIEMLKEYFLRMKYYTNKLEQFNKKYYELSIKGQEICNRTGIKSVRWAPKNTD
ncbi:PIN-like domain-containing protein [Bilophila wadsworthia]|uniref:PIN-like domain-containing protein n=1 Tax=Bilophila wadsworthia TaxID=35833 RepID=UPI002431724E|nr:PIN domain-containing protein [Bilophila wadsworthia]